MVLPVHPTPLLEQVAAHWKLNGWPETDLHRFRMALDDEGGDGGDDPDDDEPTTGADDVEKMKRALTKANKEAEKTRLKLKEYEDRDKSETERLNERTRELESNLTSAEMTALRFEIALDKGIPKSIASRLQGTTREEMEADADELLQTIGNGNGRKTPSFDGGAKDKDAPSGGSFLNQALRDRKT